MDGAMDEVVADACEMMLRDSEAVQRLAKENRSLAEKIRDWISDFAEKVRAAFAGDRATHAEARAMLDRMDALQRLWDDALVDAAKANAAKENTAGDGGVQEQARGKYWRPELNEDEWNLLNRRMETELDSEKQYLDESTKWLYAEENGVRVFALYGVGDGTEATPLYAVGGKQAATNYQVFVKSREEIRHGTDRGTEGFNSWVENLRSKRRGYRGNHTQVENRKAAGSDDRLHGRPQRGNAGNPVIDGEGKPPRVKEKFSMRDTVEQTRDLVAVHNMTEQNLRGALRLGGLPMPSIAVVKATQGHSMYGPISIVFGRESIDPQTDNRNKIYGGDAYTPTAPAVEYPVDYDRMRTVEKRLAGLSVKIAGGVFRNDSALQRAGVGEESGMSASELADKLSRDDGIRAAYLAGQGKTLEPVMQTKEFNRYGNDALAKLVQKIGVQELAGIEASMEAGDYQPVREMEMLREYKEKLDATQR